MMFLERILSFILFIIVLSCTGESTPSFSDLLTHYELLHTSDLRHTILPRDLSSNNNWRQQSRQIHFYSLDRSFSLHLDPHRNLFASSFKAVSLDATGNSQQLSVNIENFYVGHVIGDDISVVTAHLNENKLLTAHIRTTNETYYIEPARLHIKESHDNHMIIFKLSDVNDQDYIFNSLDYELVPPSSSFVPVNDRYKSHLKKRQMNTVSDTCTLAIVVDYRFYTFLLSSTSTVIDTLVSRIAAVDSISYRPTDWIIDANGNTKTGLGLQIETIIIHTEPNSDSSHYNSVAAGQPGIQNLLRRFSRGDWTSYCLAHLVTHQQFPSGKLGLAYIASPNRDETGGICSQKVIDASTGDLVNYNTGLSVVSTRKRLLLPREAELVIAHEIGHSWGSPHDPGDIEDCKLNYLMNEFAQDATKATHKQFSPCSRASIGRVLVNKAYCFKAMSTSNCGNYVIDSGEQCDGGRLTAEGHDPCCNVTCHLRSGMNCSDSNHFCCKNCGIVPVDSKVCHSVGNISNDCTRETPCNGIDYNCPTPLSAPVGSKCLQGECRYEAGSNKTRCVSLCEIAGYEQCLCTGINRCLECCVNITGDGTCQPLLSETGDPIFYPDGIFCVNGICMQGVCVDQSKDFASQLWSVITTLNINTFTVFLQENIVGCVLILSLLVWIPASCLFHFLCDVKKVWKKCLRRRSDSEDGIPDYITQSSWVQVKPDLTPLLSIDEEEVLSDDLFKPVDEPEDTTPLPAGYHDYSGPIPIISGQTNLVAHTM